MFIQIVKFKTDLSEEILLNKAKERKPEFQKIDSLLQKYYFHDTNTDEYGGIYIWESKEAMLEFRESDLAKSIPSSYKINSPPDIKLLEVLDSLRPH